MDLETVSFSLISSTAAVDMKTASAKTALFTVPTGLHLVVTAIVVRSLSATLAGGTSYSFGDSATGTGWASAIDLHLMTNTNSNDTEVIYPSAKFYMSAAGAVFGMYITTGASNAATATIDLFGYLY